jgi:competence ComEA-like helix-hairpin-helix protein
MATDGPPPLKKGTVRWAFTAGEIRILVILAVIVLLGLVLIQIQRGLLYSKLGPPVVIQEELPDGAAPGATNSRHAPGETVEEENPQKGGYLSREAGEAESNSVHSHAMEPALSDQAGKGQEKLDLNRCSTKELETLPGIGPVLAQRIADHRAQYGPFQTTRDLLLVRGIGAKTLARLDTLVTVLP